MQEAGSIIMTSSVAGISGSPNAEACIASNHAVVNVMRAVAGEAGPRKIRVNSVHYSLVANRMMRFSEERFAPA